MSLFGKIKTAIKGNPVLKEHEIGKHIASAGPGLLWKIHNGVRKSTQQEVSVFIFTKNAPEVEKLPKDQREVLFEMLKKGPTFLAKLRHPKILTLHHTVEESSDCIAFTTEPVFSSLANVLGHYDNLPSPLPLSIKEFQLHSLEGHYGLFQIAEAMEFIHNDVKLVHGNINPENVIITATGDWKLAGFNFASYDNYQTSAQTTFHFKEFNAQMSHSTNPHLDYLAPEYILSNTYDTRSDLYSYGMLGYCLYNGGNALYQNHNNTRTFKHNAEKISRITESSLGDTPITMCSLVRGLLALEPSVRPDELQVKKHAYFDDVLVLTLQYLDSLYSKSDMEKSQWFKTVLGKIVVKLPKRVIHQRVLPPLVAEFRNHKMIPFVLPIIILISEDCSMHEYSNLILPALVPVFKIHDPIQIPLIFLQKMDVILKKTSPNDMKRHILPMILATLESDNNQVQELCVSILPTFADMIDYTSMKHSIVPRLTALCISSSTVSLTVKCLVTLGQIVDSLDKDIVLQQVIPVIVKIPSKEPGVLMGILGIFHKAMTSKSIGFEKELIANRVLPYLIPLSIQTTLNKNQFGQFMIVIKDLMKKMETDHSRYLDQVGKMEEQTRSTVDFAREVSSIKASEDALKGIENMSGSGRGDDLISARVGSSNISGIRNASPMAKHDDSNMFAGMNITQQSSHSPKPTPTMASMKRLDFSQDTITHSPASQSRHQPLGTWDIPPITTPSSYVQSSVNNSRDNKPSMRESFNTGTLSTGSTLLEPTRPAVPTQSTATLNPSTGWSSSIGSVGAGSVLEPQPSTGWSTGVNQQSLGMESFSTNYQSGMAPTNLVPGLPPQSNSIGTDWFSTINNQSTTSNSFGGTLGNQTPSTGLLNPAPANESVWGDFGSSGSQSVNTGMPQRTNQNTGWSSSVAQSSFVGTGMGAMNTGMLQPQGGMGGNQMGMLQPQGGMGGNQMGMLQPVSLPMGGSHTATGNNIAPGPNPFADFNSLI